MTSPKSSSIVNEMVPLAERLRSMQLLRLVMAAVVLSFAVVAPEMLGAGLGELAPWTALYLLVSGTSEGLWRVWRRRGLTLLGAMIIADGFYLAWMSYLTGGLASPLRYLTIFHLVAVSLLASYRTGLKLALWHSLLLFVVFYAQESRILEPLSPAVRALPGTDFQRLSAYVAVFWLVAIGTAAFSAINERELRRRKFDLEALAQMAARLDRATDTAAVADALVDSAADAFGFERLVVVEVSDPGVSLLAQRGDLHEPALGSHHRVGEKSAMAAALEARETLLVSRLDREEDPWLSGLMAGSRNLLVAPMFAEGRAVGLMVAEHAMRHGSRIERRVVSMVERFVSHAALALRNASLVEQLQDMAATDELTRLANRRTFESTLHRELGRALRAGEKVGLILVDIDHFKRINDTLGHQTGDEALRQIAGVLARNCRDFDTVARFGGEEFAVIMPGGSEADCMAAAERLRHAIAETDTVAPVTASAGVAVYPLHATDAAGLVKTADDALYQSKRTGRNRVTRALGGPTRGDVVLS